MTIIHQPTTVLDFIYMQKAEGLSVGFVPTMGALHAGHIRLIEASAASCDLTVCSIFVNPTQFNDPGDYRKYPNRLSEDIRLLAAAGTNTLFLPSVSDLYPNGTEHLERYDLGDLETKLEGAFRPGHFQGVCQVMARLLRAVQPDFLFMGQKDYQQCMVVQKLIDLLQFNVKLMVNPTVRESDGLAMSSRNLRLSDAERATAPAMFRALQHLRKGLQRQQSLSVLLAEAENMLVAAGFRIDYLEAAEATTLNPVDHWDGKSRLVALAAAFLGEIRLIDNLELTSTAPN